MKRFVIAIVITFIATAPQAAPPPAPLPEASPMELLALDGVVAAIIAILIRRKK